MKKLTRLGALSLSVALSLGACGGGDGNDGPDPDADVQPANAGFVPPAATVVAFDGDTELGDANFDCLRTPSDDLPTELDVALTGTVRDFQTGEAVPNAAIEAFSGIDIANPFATATGLADGTFALTIPTGEERIGFKVSVDGALDTYLLNQIFDPATADQSAGIDSVSDTTATTVAAFVGVQRSVERGVLAAAVRDCDGNEVANAIATVSSVSAMPEHLEGAASFYFSAETDLPAGNNLVPATTANGLFVVLELPPAAEAFLQVWGFLPGQDPATDDLTLLAELRAPVVANTVITASLDPLRQ